MNFLKCNNCHNTVLYVQVNKDWIMINLYRHEKHLAFHRKYPEKFAPEGVLEQTGGASSPYQSLPVYFGNVCLRFLPVSWYTLLL